MEKKINKPIFSIIVPVFNVEKYLERCICSLITQTERNIEIILVDDGSYDSSPQICDNYAEKDDRINVIHKENGGLSDARNKGIEASRGEYIMFVDSDDYIDSDSCERIVTYTKEKVDIIVTDGIVEGSNINLVHSGAKNNLIYKGKDFIKLSMLTGKIPMAAWLYVYNREFIVKNKLRFKEGILHEDEEFTPRAILLADRIVNSGIMYYHYVIRVNSITTASDKRKNANDLYETCCSLCEIYDTLEDVELRAYLKDSLVNKYLSLYQEGRLYKYGKSYLHKSFMLKNAYKKRTRIKAFIYGISPRLYWYFNNYIKVRSK